MEMRDGGKEGGREGGTEGAREGGSTRTYMKERTRENR